MLPAQVVVGEARVVEQLVPADQPAPALEHRLAGHLEQDPTVRHRVEIARRDRVAAVAHPGLSTPSRSRSIRNAFDIMERRQQRSLDVLALAGRLPVEQRHHDAERQVRAVPKSA